jgi:hypothetical protein
MQFIFKVFTVSIMLLVGISCKQAAHYLHVRENKIFILFYFVYKNSLQVIIKSGEQRRLL